MTLSVIFLFETHNPSLIVGKNIQQIPEEDILQNT